MLPLLRVRTGLRSPLLTAGMAALLSGEPDLLLAQDSDAEVLILDEESLGEWLAEWSAGWPPSSEPPHAAHTETGVVVLSDAAPWLDELLERPLAWAWLSPDAERPELLAAVRAAGAGLVSMPMSVARALWQGAAQEPGAASQAGELPGDLLPPAGERVSLTPRESEVLALLGLGLSNKRMARELGVSDHTIKFHVAALYAKLNVSSRTAAVTRAIQLGLWSV